jgi:hypothetical protein
LPTPLSPSNPRPAALKGTAGVLATAAEADPLDIVSGIAFGKDSSELMLKLMLYRREGRKLSETGGSEGKARMKEATLYSPLRLPLFISGEGLCLIIHLFNRKYI